MLITILKSKIHGATITDCKVNYEGSIAIDEDLLDAANIVLGEQVQVLNFSNNTRFTTYAIAGKRGSGEIGLRGPAAKLGKKGEMIIILTYCHIEPEKAVSFKPAKVFVNAKNKIKKTK